ncbi:DUF1492 domain-containing protein [Hutsoniella sourekii]|uniref:DUF1492 domain-containing protein n=1 Tax=Hutsoniella sourekii TaxID=87650 RepID=UPI00047F33FE|nr:DUF1492 domain-containing protein [Hutsoniella sourekii]
MTPKQYLQQAFYLDQAIENKIEQVDAWNQLATKMTMTYSNLPKSKHYRPTSFEDTLIKIIEMQEEINQDIDRLVDLKLEIKDCILKLKDKEAQVVLEKRYLCFKKWEEIAVEMNFDTRQVFRIHNRGLQALDRRGLTCQ